LGRHFIICDGAEIARLWGGIGAGNGEVLSWVPQEGESRARPAGFHAIPGGLSPESIARLGPKPGDEFAVVSEDPAFARSAVSAIDQAAPRAPVLVLSDRVDGSSIPEHPCLLRAGLRSLIRDDIDLNFRHLENLRRVVDLRALLDARERLAILLQPDPDPDGIACGYTLRALLGRRRTTAPLVSFGEVKRAENRAMVQALGIEVKTIAPTELEDYDAVALVDVQPAVFGDGAPPRLRKVDVVIDHHPNRAGYEAAFVDVRTGYGATSTILTEYVRAADLEITPRLATALLYGIKSDTQLLGRETSKEDIDAFAFLHALHSPALLRRIERPALPEVALRALGRALSKAKVESGIYIIVLGRVREDVIPQVADLGLQAEGAEWSIAAGIVGRDLVFSVRNVGYVRGAGEVVRLVVEGFGLGGGHRSMAKGTIPLKVFQKRWGRATRARIHEALLKAFQRTIAGDAGGG
jgi:nanoRNase/pAp phosphatase (c-di-AMP/oligoRNAs hydrolase)